MVISILLAGKVRDIIHWLQCVSYVTTVCSRILIISVYLGMICMVLPYKQKQNSMICTHSVVVVYHSGISLEKWSIVQ